MLEGALTGAAGLTVGCVTGAGGGTSEDPVHAALPNGVVDTLASLTPLTSPGIIPRSPPILRHSSDGLMRLADIPRKPELSVGGLVLTAAPSPPLYFSTSSAVHPGATPGNSVGSGTRGAPMGSTPMPVSTRPFSGEIRFCFGASPVSVFVAIIHLLPFTTVFVLKSQFLTNRTFSFVASFAYSRHAFALCFQLI